MDEFFTEHGKHIGGLKMLFMQGKKRMFFLAKKHLQHLSGESAIFISHVRKVASGVERCCKKHVDVLLTEHGKHIGELKMRFLQVKNDMCF